MVKGVRFIWEPVQLAMQRRVEQNSAVWPGGGLRMYSWGWRRGGVSSSWCPASWGRTEMTGF